MYMTSVSSSFPIIIKIVAQFVKMKAKNSMCVVCLLIDKESITTKEAKRALWEQINFAKTRDEELHLQELYAKLDKEEKKA